MSILAEILHGELSAPSAQNPSVAKAFDAWFLKACQREPEGRFASVSEQVEALAEALGLASVPRDPSLERVASWPRSLEVDETLRAATISHRVRNPSTRRALAVGALFLAAAAAAVVYRASNVNRVDVSTSAKPAATAPTEPTSSPVDVSATVGSPVAREPPTAAASAPPSTPAETAPPSLPFNAKPAIAVTSSSSAVDKPRLRLPRGSTAAEPAKAADPFKDQK
jgi:serine/threonine-protein kinase